MLNDLYTILKDVYKYFTYKEEIIPVNMQWVANSPFAKRWREEERYDLIFVREDEIEDRRTNGWEIMKNLDKKKRVRYSFVVKDHGGNLTLMGRKS